MCDKITGPDLSEMERQLRIDALRISIADDMIEFRVNRADGFHAKASSYRKDADRKREELRAIEAPSKHIGG